MTGAENSWVSELETCVGPPQAKPSILRQRPDESYRRVRGAVTEHGVQWRRGEILPGQKIWLYLIG